MHVVTLYLINRVSVCMECVKFGEQLFSWFCPFTLWVLDAELGLSGLEANAFFTHRTISLAPSIYLIFFLLIGSQYLKIFCLVCLVLIQVENSL